MRRTGREDIDERTIQWRRGRRSPSLLSRIIFSRISRHVSFAQPFFILRITKFPPLFGNPGFVLDSIALQLRSRDDF